MKKIKYTLLAFFCFLQTIIIAQTVIQLTNDNEKYDQPTWSPNGSKIAFTKKNGGLYMMDADGKNMICLLSDTVSKVWFSWSMDNSHIAFAAYKPIETTIRPDGFWYIGMVNIENRVSEVLFENANNIANPNPYWHYLPEGKQVCYVDSKPSLHFSKTIPYTNNVDCSRINNKDIFFTMRTNGLYTLHASGEMSKFTSRFGHHPILSNNRERVVYNENGNLIIANFIDTLKVIIGSGTCASWSPDDKKIVYIYSEDKDDMVDVSDLYIFNLETQRSIILKKTPEKLEFYTNWSPDGKSIIYSLFPSGPIFKIIL